ncbi:MAG: HEAT repeat domain-containing protein, partial [Planctomycetes bacterium]|nr:HEAT repeat domain-containing protein [Planctomycetota bacterium]
MLWVATTILALAPQGPVGGRDGRIVLPPTRGAEQAPQKPAVRDGEQRRFHERALELRRSRFLSEVSEEDLLRRIGGEFEDAAARAIKLARSADDDVMHGVMRILATYGGVEEAGEIKFLLHTRSFGKATGIAVSTMATIARDSARDMLFDCMTASREIVRRLAADELERRVQPEDSQRLITLAGQGRADVRVRALRLLGSVPTDRATDVLLTALRDDSRFAVEACRSLIEVGEPVVAPLTEILRRPAKGQEFGFAAFALASIEERLGRELFEDVMRPHLLAELDMPDPFMRSAVAIALSGMAWRSPDTNGATFHDHAVVDALVSVVAPSEFVQHVSLIQDLARNRLVRLTGEDFQLDNRKWRSWWDTVGKVEGYVGARQHLEVTSDTARAGVLTWKDPKNHIRLRGESIDPLPPSDDLVVDLLVAPEEFVDIVTQLHRAGFMRETNRRATVPAESSLRLTVGGARCQTDPMADLTDLAPLGAVVHRAAFDRIWQLYRDPA